MLCSFCILVMLLIRFVLPNFKLNPRFCKRKTQHIVYVGIEEKAEDDEPFDEKMKRLTSELSGMFAKSHQLEEEIKKNLEGIGFKI